jgi:GMP synthase (glutamine-hydrolysing)
MTTNIHADRILIIDFGSQYTQLIARRVREAGVYCEIWPYDNCASALEGQPRGIILSGGPETVTGDDTPRAPQQVFEQGVPVLGICYGMQTMAAQLGGEVAASSKHEYGYAQVQGARPFQAVARYRGSHQPGGLRLTGCLDESR